LLAAAQLALTKTTGQPENDLRNARNNATLIDNQNKRNKELLDSIDKYSFLRFKSRERVTLFSIIKYKNNYMIKFIKE